MQCLQCGRQNAPSQLYCTTCGAPLNLERDKVQAELASELDMERSQAAESFCRSTLGITLAVIVALFAVRKYTTTLPNPDLVHFLKLPPMPIEPPPLIDLGQSAGISLTLQPTNATEGKPARDVLLEKEKELRRKVYGIDNVILMRKSTSAPIRGRILRADDEFLYLADPVKTLGTFRVPQSEVRKILPAPDAAPEP